MSERISIKGKGADLFFGGDDVPQNPPSDELRNARKKDSVLSGKPTSNQASVPESKMARPPASKTVRPPEIQEAMRWPSDAVRRLRDALSEDHPVNNTFRFSQESLDAIRDVAYELEVKRSLKTSRNDIMRLALAWIIDDYRINGTDSLLVAVLKDERWKPHR